METQLFDSIRSLAERQHGHFSRSQALELGATVRQLRHLAESGVLRRESDTVFRFRGAATTENAQVMRAVLDAGPTAMASHWTAAALAGTPGTLCLPVHVLASRSKIRGVQYLARVHEPRSLIEPHRVLIDGIPATTPARTLFDIAGLRGVGAERVERLVDAMLARRLTTVGRLDAVLGQLAKRGRPGIRVMREIIEERKSGVAPVESGLEYRFHELAKEAGVTGFVRQVDVGDDDDWIGRMDFVHASSASLSKPTAHSTTALCRVCCTIW